MKANGQLLQLAHLNDKFKWGNAVWHPKGISPCICEAAGCGGGACAADTYDKEKGMKIATPKTVDGLCAPTLTTRQAVAGWCDFIDMKHHPHGACLYIRKVPGGG